MILVGDAPGPRFCLSVIGSIACRGIESRGGKSP